MTIRKFAVTAGLALAAEAFMIPSTISLPGVEIDKDGDFHALRIPDQLSEQLKHLHIGVSKPHDETTSTNVRLECPGCTFQAEGSSVEEIDASPANELVLDFAISDDTQSLNLNGHPLYPLSAQIAPITAHQIAQQSSADSEEVLSAERQLDYTAFSSSIDAADGTDAQLIDFFLAVNGLGSEPINVDSVDIRMLQDESGNLHLVHMITKPNKGMPNGMTQEHPVHNPTGSPSVCPSDSGIATVLCRLRAALKQKAEHYRLLQPTGAPRGYHKMKPCPGRKGHGNMSLKGGPNKFMTQDAEGKPAFRGHHHHHHGHHGHHSHRGMIHTVARMLRGFVAGFVIPVVIGVAAGMSASILGMLVGSLIAWLWIKLVRGGKRGGAGSARQEERAARVEGEDEEEALMVGEKDGLLLAHAPAYVDEEEVVAVAPPVYVEKE